MSNPQLITNAMNEANYAVKLDSEHNYIEAIKQYLSN